MKNVKNAIFSKMKRYKRPEQLRLKKLMSSNHHNEHYLVTNYVGTLLIPPGIANRVMPTIQWACTIHYLMRRMQHNE